jgi:hypothetical protein
MKDKLKAILSGGIAVGSTDDMNVGPRAEMLLNQNTYVGLWCWSDAARTIWSIEVSEVRLLGSLDPVSCWFEDGHMNRATGNLHETAFYATAEEALAKYTQIIMDLTDRSAV